MYATLSFVDERQVLTVI
jgi:hypothetical protein